MLFQNLKKTLPLKILQEILSDQNVFKLNV